MIFLLSLALAQTPAPAQLVLGGAQHTTLDLWRPWADADKIYVMVGLPDGSSELFLVDTGASVSVLTDSVAERLGLATHETGGVIQGLGGSVPWVQSTIPQMTLGDFKLNAVDVAVGVPGVPDMAGALPVGGILGNNVWSNFVMVVDYPADLMELHLEHSYHVPRRAHPMMFDGYHTLTPVLVHAEREGQIVEQSVVVEVDTGAYDLLFSGPTGEPFRDVTTVGVEPVFGVGADLDTLPESDFLQLTRRIPVTEVKLGKTWIPYEQSVRWVGADTPPKGPTGLSGLLGYGVLKDYRVVFDYAGQHLHLEPSNKHPHREFDAVAAYLEREQKLHPNDPSRALIRARLQLAGNDISTAKKTVEAALVALPKDVPLRVMLARIQRYEGDAEASVQTLRELPPLDMEEEGEWVAFINSLALAGHADEALQRARAALSGDLSAATNSSQAQLLVALSDALLATNHLSEAAAAIDDATELSGGTNGHLLRKARIAYMEGDRYGTITTLRKLIDIYPLNGIPMWLYGLMVTPVDQATYLYDVQTAINRLHPGDQPWDFVGAGLNAIGQHAQAREALASGYERDCGDLSGSERDNCDAWYWSLEGDRLKEAEEKIAKALTAEPQNSAFEDTATMVSLAAGHKEAALAHARRAAILSPDDPYLLWQLSRLENPTTEK